MQFSVSLCALSCFDGTKRPSTLDVSIRSMTLNQRCNLRRPGGTFRRDKCLSGLPPFTFKVQFVRKFAKSCKIGRVIADRPSNAPSMIDLISQNESVETNALGPLVSVPYSADNGDQWQDNEGGATDLLCPDSLRACQRPIWIFVCNQEYFEITSNKRSWLPRGKN